jgi:hypothetical protein
MYTKKGRSVSLKLRIFLVFDGGFFQKVCGSATSACAGQTYQGGGEEAHEEEHEGEHSARLSFVGAGRKMRQTSPPSWPTGTAYALKRGRDIPQIAYFCCYLSVACRYELRDSFEAPLRHNSLYSDQFYSLLVGTGLVAAGRAEHPEPEGCVCRVGV